ncbi:MAG: cell envelope protein, partial [Candidatus Krumholzibacteria bacterium]|nr:cell envelope protein [Candidatus Krumholzibacteria bacterium]
MKTRLFVATVFVLSAVASCGPKEPEITPAEIRAIAKEAYVYGFPLVDGYRVLHSYFVDTAGPDYKGPWNELVSVARVYTP